MLWLTFHRFLKNRPDDRRQQQRVTGRMDVPRKEGTQEETEELTQSQRRLVNRPDRSHRWTVEEKEDDEI